MTDRSRTIARLTGWARRRLPGFVLLLLAARPVASHAQWLAPSVGVGVGAASVRYAETLETTMVSVTPTLSWLGSHAFVSASGVLASAAVQGALAAAVTTSFDAPVAADLTLLTGGSRASAAVTHQTRLTGRLQLRAERGGVWLGSGIGTVADGSARSTTRVHDLGGWVEAGPMSATLTHLPTAAGDSVRFTDTELALRWSWARLSIDAMVGWRAGSARVAGLDDPGRWRSLTGTLRLTDRLAVVAGAGSYPLDLLQGFPAGRFTTMSLRLTPSRATARPAGIDADAPSAAAASAPDADGMSALVVRTLEDGRRRLRVRAVGATTVEMQGSMTAWTSVPLTAEGDGWFVVDLAIPAGTHELALRRDGGRWMVPPGLAPRVDEFGVATGVLFVGR